MSSGSLSWSCAIRVQDPPYASSTYSPDASRFYLYQRLNGSLSALRTSDGTRLWQRQVPASPGLGQADAGLLLSQDGATLVLPLAKGVQAVHTGRQTDADGQAGSQPA